MSHRRVANQKKKQIQSSSPSCRTNSSAQNVWFARQFKRIANDRTSDERNEFTWSQSSSIHTHLAVVCFESYGRCSNQFNTVFGVCGWNQLIQNRTRFCGQMIRNNAITAKQNPKPLELYYKFSTFVTTPNVYLITLNAIEWNTVRCGMVLFATPTLLENKKKNKPVQHIWDAGFPTKTKHIIIAHSECSFRLET